MKKHKKLYRENFPRESEQSIVALMFNMIGNHLDKLNIIDYLKQVSSFSGYLTVLGYVSYITFSSSLILMKLDYVKTVPHLDLIHSNLT